MPKKDFHISLFLKWKFSVLREFQTQQLTHQFNPPSRTPKIEKARKFEKKKIFFFVDIGKLKNNSVYNINSFRFAAIYNRCWVSAIGDSRCSVDLWAGAVLSITCFSLFSNLDLEFQSGLSKTCRRQKFNWYDIYLISKHNLKKLSIMSSLNSNNF